MGKNISGKAKFANLAKMPHALIAGATGSGKSVTVHAIITSLLYRNNPDDLKFIFVENSVFYFVYLVDTNNLLRVVVFIL